MGSFERSQLKSYIRISADTFVAKNVRYTIRHMKEFIRYFSCYWIHARLTYISNSVIRKAVK